jgi:hypothetical protein
LKALPCSSLGTRLDNASLRVAVALRLGLPVSSRFIRMHNYVKRQLMPLELMHLSAVKILLVADVRTHNAVNDLIKRALASVHIKARLEPACLSRDHACKRPDGLTLMPWATGRCLIWDFTC